jgi:hypothetical protein
MRRLINSKGKKCCLQSARIGQEQLKQDLNQFELNENSL